MSSSSGTSSSSSSTTRLWQEAWDAAQPRLKELSSSLEPVKGRILRVSQLDAHSLDNELGQLLLDPLTTSFPFSRYEAELSLFVHLLLYKLSVWDTGSSYGAKLQQLRLRAPRNSRGPLTLSGIPRRTLILHGLLTILLPYLHTRLRVRALSHAWPDAPRTSLRRRLWNTLSNLESLHALASLTGFIVFLSDGRYRTLADRLLKLRLVPTRPLLQRDVSYEFMNRQMIWYAFTEFLIFLLPLVDLRTARRRFLSRPLSAANSIFGISSPSSDTHLSPQLVALPADECAICLEDEIPTAIQQARHLITTPYITQCGHMYCYVCLSERMLHTAEADKEEERLWKCLRCGQRVRDARRLIPEDVDEDTDTPVELDTTDLEELSSLNSRDSPVIHSSDPED